jgi:Organic solute transport protein 1
MAALVAPLVVGNMGCEMLFIIQQRLHAQQAPIARCSTVLSDLTKELFATELVDSLFQPRLVMPGLSEMHNLLSHLARCSVMRLSMSRCGPRWKGSLLAVITLDVAT